MLIFFWNLVKLNYMKLLKLTSKIIKKIAQKYQLELLLLFGSQISERISKESDYDIAYLSKKDLTVDEEINLNYDLMDIFNSDKIDLVNLKKANPLLTFEIAKQCQVIFGDKKILLEFKTSSFKKYIEHLPLLDLERVLIKKRQALLKELLYGR